MIDWQLVAFAASIATILLGVFWPTEKKQLPPPPAPTPSPDPPKASDQPRHLTPQAQREADAIQQLLTHLAFTTYPIEIGREKVGESVVGENRQEVPWPADDMDVRPIRGLDEWTQRLPGEHVYPLNMQIARALSGDTLVQVHEEVTIITEPVYKPLYRQEQVAVYLLLDISPSMFPGSGEAWRLPIWKGIAVEMVRRTVAAGATFMIRFFDEGVSDLTVVKAADDAEALVQRILKVDRGSGTSVDQALRKAVTDFKRRKALDRAELMIVTDGESTFNAVELRKKLNEANIKLHAVLLGQSNNDLRACADIYYEVQPGPVVLPPVHRSH